MHKKLIVVVIITILLALGASWYRLSDTKNSSSGLELGKPFEMKIGQTVTISNTPLKVTLSQLISDSRCPDDVDCITAGNVAVSMRVTDTKDSQALTLYSGLAGEDYHNYHLTISHVAPERGSMKQEINSNDYVFTVVISKIQ